MNLLSEKRFTGKRKHGHIDITIKVVDDLDFFINDYSGVDLLKSVKAMLQYLLMLFCKNLKNEYFEKVSLYEVNAVLNRSVKVLTSRSGK